MVGSLLVSDSSVTKGSKCNSSITMASTFVWTQRGLNWIMDVEEMGRDFSAAGTSPGTNLSSGAFQYVDSVEFVDNGVAGGYFKNLGTVMKTTICDNTTSPFESMRTMPRQQGFVGSQQDCQALCPPEADADEEEVPSKCESIYTARCDLWAHEPETTSGIQGFACMKLDRSNT